MRSPPLASFLPKMANCWDESSLCIHSLPAVFICYPGHFCTLAHSLQITTLSILLNLCCASSVPLHYCIPSLTLVVLLTHFFASLCMLPNQYHICCIAPRSLPHPGSHLPASSPATFLLILLLGNWQAVALPNDCGIRLIMITGTAVIAVTK